MGSVKDVATLYQNLKTEWAKKPRKLDKCGELLNKIKVSNITMDDLTLIKHCSKYYLQKIFFFTDCTNTINFFAE